MKTVALTCPNCNANIEPVDGLDTFFCSHCGAKIVLEGMSDAGYNARVKIKEFALVERELEHKERIRSKEIEQEERIKAHEIKRDIRRDLLKYFKSDNGVVIAVILALFIICIVILIGTKISSCSSRLAVKQSEKNLEKIEKDIEDAFLAGNYDAAEIKINQLRLDEGDTEDISKWDDKRNYYSQMLEKKRKDILLSKDYLQIPAASDYFDGMDYSTAVTIFEDAGLDNIECKPSTEEKGFFTKSGSVEHISVGGKIEFSTDDLVTADDPIIIYYYE